MLFMDSYLDVGSLPTTDFAVVGQDVGTTSPVPDVTPQLNEHPTSVLPLDAALLMPSNDDLFNAAFALDDGKMLSKVSLLAPSPMVSETLLGDLTSPSPGMVNFIMGIDGLSHPVQPPPQQHNAATVAGSQTLRERAPSSFPPPASAVRLFEAAPAVQVATVRATPFASRARPGGASARNSTRPRRASAVRMRSYASSPSPPPAGKSSPPGRPIQGAQHVPRAVPRTPKYVASPLDAAIAVYFPVEVLRAGRDEYKLALRTDGPKLTRPQMLRLRELRRKELSCVYADNARHRRIGRMEELEQEVAKLKAENARLRAGLMA